MVKTTKEKVVTKSDVNILWNALNMSKNEMDVSSAWRSIFKKYFVDLRPIEENATMASPFDTDGFITTGGELVFALRILLEFKDGTDLTKAFDRARVTAQVIHYMKAFKENGHELPNVVVGADQNQAFVLYAPNFYHYLDNDGYKWDVAPSSAFRVDTLLMQDLLKDNNIAVWVYDLQRSANASQRYENIKQLFKEINSLADDRNGETYKVKVTPATVTGMFDQFKQLFKKPDKVAPVDAVNIFLQLLTGNNADKYYQLPANPNQLHTPNDKLIDVDGVALNAFFKHFDRRLTVKEEDDLKEIGDRLIEDQTRRIKGDFWTPTFWANRADQMFQEAFGQDYKSSAIVWDCASGASNLTRDFSYSSLFVSTYHEAEISMGQEYNPEAISKFQYDFLNDDVGKTVDNTPDPNDWKMPNQLFNALKQASKTGKRVIFYTNPPYGTAGDNNKVGKSKENISNSAVNLYMKQNKYGRSSQQLYAQFFTRVMLLTEAFHLQNVAIGFFTKVRQFAGGSFWKQFNQKFFSRFKFVKGNMISSGEFKDTKDVWTVTFSIYQQRPSIKQDLSAEREHTFSIESKQWDNLANKEVLLKEKDKTTRMVYEDALIDWVREAVDERKLVPADYAYPQLSSAMKESKGQRPTGRFYNGSLGYIMNSGNNIGEGTVNSGVWIGSSSAYHGHGFNVFPENIDRAVVNFTARRAVEPHWYNDTDNFARPDESNPLYKEFVNDSLVFSLFENASYQASFRNFGYSNTNLPNKWVNHWFWLDIDFVREHTQNYSFIYNDTRGDKQRFVAEKLKQRQNEGQLSQEAQAVLQSANKVWLEALPQRELLYQDFSDFSLQAWDAGWFQIKQVDHLIKLQSMQEFRENFAKLKEKVRENIFELGMLTR